MFEPTRGTQYEVGIKTDFLLSPSVQVVHVDEVLFYLGWAYFQQHQDKHYSLTDAVSFVVMQQHDIQIAYTFDQHFTQAGF